MFENLTDSFQDTVARAKEEREQLDLLLTVSTPRERLLVTVIAVVLLALATWLAFGNVARSLAADGVVVGAGDGAPDTGPVVRALVWMESDVARHLEAGMPAAIRLAGTGGAADTLDGKVAAVTAVVLSGEAAALGAAAPASVYRLDLALAGALDPASLAGVPCQIVIEVGRQPPIALFGTRMPAS